MLVDPQKVDFESQLSNLEALVTSLESGDLSLEDSLTCFEKGIKIARDCHDALRNAEQRVELLTQEGNTLVSQRFEPDQK